MPFSAIYTKPKEPAQTILQVLRRTNNFTPPSHPRTNHGNPLPSRFLPLTHNSEVLGYIDRERVLPHILSDDSDRIFTVSPDESFISFSSHINSIQERGTALETLLQTWRSRDVFPCLRGWREERFPVYVTTSKSKTEGFLSFERSAVGLFGFPCYGTHLNLFISAPQSTPLSDLHRATKMWIARRSKTKQTYPGFLDNCVGGGLSLYSTPWKTLRKECEEEAGLPPHLVAQARSVGAITYFLDHPVRGLVNGTEFCFDLDLARTGEHSWTPTAADGEVDEFMLMDIVEVRVLSLPLSKFATLMHI